MHNFILKLFGFLRSFIYFIRMMCVLCIIFLVLYWIQNLTHASWAWIGFMKPFLDGLLNVANQIYSVSFDVFGTVFELKYLSAVIILVIASLLLKLLSYGLVLLEGLYNSAHFVCKKTEEAIFNKKMNDDLKKEEKKLVKYTVTIHTQVKAKYAYQESKINLDEQNQLMNKFLMEKLNVKPMVYQGGYMYNFSNFEKVDNILDILFKVINSQAPLNYAICIQVGENAKQLNKLIELKHYGKISIASDTAYRYEFNESKRYQLSQLGLFQYEGGTLEVHEFKEVL